MRKDEIDFYPIGDYMPMQVRLTHQMRTDLVDWLFELQSILRVEGRTIHVAVNMIDRYLWKRQMVPTAMKLLGIGALRTACKQIEGRNLSPEIIIQNANKYKIKSWNIEEMEDLLSSLLKDKKSPPTVLCFLEMYARGCGLVQFEKMALFAHFLADLAVLMHQNNIFLPSTIAMCCMRFALRRYAPLCTSEKIPISALARKIDSAMIHSGIQEKEVDICSRELFLNFQRFMATTTALRKKYNKRIDFLGIYESSTPRAHRGV